MGLRHRSIRMRIFLLVAIPILALMGLYAFAAATTTRAALDLSRTRTVKDKTGLPTGNLEAQAGTERLLAVIYLAAPVPQNLQALQHQEQKTNAASELFSRSVATPATMDSAAPPERQAIEALLKSTTPAALDSLRSQVTGLRFSRAQAMSAYGAIITEADAVLNRVILQETNVPLATQSLALVRMGRSEQLLLQEDALVIGDLAARSFSAADRQQFTQLVGARRTILAQTLPDLTPAYRAVYLKNNSPQTAAALAELENKIINDAHPRARPPVSPAAWNHAVGATSAGASRAGFQLAEALTAQAQPIARSTFLRLFSVGGLGLLAVLLSIIMSIWIGRGLLRELAGLRQSALELANDRLPSVMERLRAGQDVDVAAEAPPMESAGDEFGQVRQAFNAVQRTAIEAAVDEAMLRRGISDVFRNLARRSQSLLHRQLALLDGMERRASGPEELEDLFRIDHLTTRMRRHAEGLIILSGESPGRGWRHPVPIVDVLRAAVAEVEDYTRIRVVSRTQAALAGPAVADVIHLIAELAENATIYSPPNTPVRILGDVVGRGFAIEIEDRGLGITSDKLTEINGNLASPPQFDLSGSDRLGLFIAGRLAQRHDIQITLRPSAYGGTTAIVLIPSDLIVNADPDALENSPGAARERAIRLTGRHAALSQGDPFGPLRLPEPAMSATDEQAPVSEPPDAEPSAARSPAAESPATAVPAADFAPDWLPADSSPAAAGEASASPFAFTSEPLQQQDWGPPETDTRVSTADLTHLGLPRRIRQASLAPQLRAGGIQAPSGGDASPSDEPSPEAARSTMTALQRGWERGRSPSGAPEPDVVIDPEPVTGEFTLDRNDE
jgi:signal transduction histidine kinase